MDQGGVTSVLPKRKREEVWVEVNGLAKRGQKLAPLKGMRPRENTCKRAILEHCP